MPARFAVLDESQAGEMLAQATDERAGARPRERRSRSSPTRSPIVSVDAAGERLTACARRGRCKAIKCERFRHDARGRLGAPAHERSGLPRRTRRPAIERAMLEGGLAARRNGRRHRAGASSSRQATDAEARRLAAAAVAGRDVAPSGCELYRSRLPHRGWRRTPRARLGTKAVAAADQRTRSRTSASASPRFCDKRKAADAVERTKALFTLAAAIVHAGRGRTSSGSARSISTI